MHSSFPVDAGIFLGAVLIIVGMVLSGVAGRYRLPGLVFFLLIVALVAILFQGGLATSPNAFLRAGAPAALLATKAIGFGARLTLRKVRLPNASSYPVLALAVAGLSYGVATEFGSSGFLAVYLTGVILRRKRHLARPLMHFHEGLATAAEAVLFLMLGLPAFPSRLLDVLGPGLVVAAVVMFVARPVAIAVCLPWFRFDRREFAVVSWAGLRGASRSCWPPFRSPPVTPTGHWSSMSYWSPCSHR